MGWVRVDPVLIKESFRHIEACTKARDLFDDTIDCMNLEALKNKDIEAFKIIDERVERKSKLKDPRQVLIKRGSQIRDILL